MTHNVGIPDGGGPMWFGHLLAVALRDRNVAIAASCRYYTGATYNDISRNVPGCHANLLLSSIAQQCCRRHMHQPHIKRHKKPTQSTYEGAAALASIRYSESSLAAAACRIEVEQPRMTVALPSSNIAFRHTTVSCEGYFSSTARWILGVLVLGYFSPR